MFFGFFFFFFSFSDAMPYSNLFRLNALAGGGTARSEEGELGGR